MVKQMSLTNLFINLTLANLSIYYTWKNITSEYNDKKFLFQLGMMNLICLMDLILFLIFNIILNI